MSSAQKILLGIAAAALLSTSAIAQGLVTQKNISLAMAQEIANGAMEKCKAMGFKASVEVVDRAGLPIVMLRGDGAGRRVRRVSTHAGSEERRKEDEALGCAHA